jgi:hypothetical protein
MVAPCGNSIAFGNTRQPGGPIYLYTKAEWEAFLAGVKLGDFDDLI